MKNLFLLFIYLSYVINVWAFNPNKIVDNPIDTIWNNIPVLLSHINAPTFPNRNINIVTIGAPTNGTTICTAYIQKAIDSVSEQGGGKVIIPPGIFLTGAIKLKSNVNLYLSPLSTLQFSTNTADYLPVVLTRYEGIECYNYSPFIYAYGATNIAISGSGTLDGQASYANWWAWKGSMDENLVYTMGNNDTPLVRRVFGAGHQLRPVFIQLYNSSNILIDSVTVINSPMWEINPVLSNNITIQHVNINSYGPNNDGIDPECSNYVWINDCTFNTGDDCIAIKSGRNTDGRRINVPSQNIVIQNCFMKDGHGAITMGSECSGGIRNVYAENCTMSSPNLNIAFRIKTNSVRGGVIENLFFRNCTITQVSTDVLDVNMNYQEGDVGSFTPIVRNIELKNIQCSKSTRAFWLVCYNRSPVTDIKVIDCNFNNTTASNILTNVCRMQVYNSFINGAVPLIPVNATGFTEAETYTNKLSWGWSNVQASFNGNGYMEFADSLNSIEWQTARSKNEMDTINIKYFNVGPVNKPCYLMVNNTRVSQILFESSSSAWKTSKQLVPLIKGVNVVKLISGITNKPGAYIDRLSYTVSPALYIKPDTVSLCPSDGTFFIAPQTGINNWQWQVDTGHGFFTINDGSMFNGVNNDTLFLNNVSSSWSGAKYRCSLNGGSSFSKVYTIKFVSTWTGAIDNAWEHSDNWSCGIVPDANTEVFINGPSMLNYPVINSMAFCKKLYNIGALVTIKTGYSLTITGN